MATLGPLHTNQENKGKNTYDFERGDEPYISDVHDTNLEEQAHMTLQDDEPFQHDDNKVHTSKN